MGGVVLYELRVTIACNGRSVEKRR